MRKLIVILSLFLPFIIMESCNQNENNNKELQAQIDSLQIKLNNAYKPGTGEIMNNIVQAHHLKLWIAGQNKNWALAEYERHMIEGGFKRILKFHKGTPEAIATPMIYPALDSLDKAIREKDANAFKTNFAILTTACNTCHSATNYKFNVIVVPTTQSISNQRFN